MGGSCEVFVLPEALSCSLTQIEDFDAAAEDEHAGHYEVFVLLESLSCSFMQMELVRRCYRRRMGGIRSSYYQKPYRVRLPHLCTIMAGVIYADGLVIT